MKYLLYVLAFVVSTAVQAQTFEWNSKSPVQTQDTPSAAQQAAYEKAYNERQVGMAGTYYGTAEGRQTAYGETFRNSEMTASHRLLPLGTLLQVINLDNGKRATVRVNDRGQSCNDCLLQLSATAASSLGIQGYGQVSVERVGFSNWNPAPPRQPVAAAPATYNQAPTYSPQSYGTVPAQGGVVRPVSIGGETVGWTSKGGAAPQAAPNSYGTVPTYQQTPGQVRPGTVQPAPTPAPQANAAVLSAPSVLSREVNPTTRANQPATFSRRPTVVPQPQTVPQPAPTATPQSYYSPTQAYQQPQPYYGQQAPAQQSPAQVVPQQAAPPQPTVQRFQARGGTVVPESYGQQTVMAPTAYAAVPAAAPAPVAAASPGAKTGFAVQLGAYNNELYAKNRVTQLQASGLANVFYLSSVKPDGQVINRVYAGTFPTMADAQVAATDIRNDYQIAGIVTKM